MKSEPSEPPKPGSDRAVEQGCTCPRMDNAYGAGIMSLGTDWYVNEGCPLHDPKATNGESATDLE